MTKQIVAAPASTREVVIPAVYATRQKQVLVSPATTKVVETPAQYETRVRQLLAAQATTKETEIPAESKTYTRTVVKSAAKTTEKTIPAEYGSFVTTTKVADNMYADWVEVICGNKLTVEKIIQIQRALKVKGYDPGPIDDVIGPRTRAALTQFQKDNNLPLGNINIETLKALGLNDN